MLKPFFVLGAALAGLSATAATPRANPGDRVPEFNAIKWYNTAPLTLEDLKGKAVLLQVFRTW